MCRSSRSFLRKPALLHIDDVLELVQEEYVHRGDVVTSQWSLMPGAAPGECGTDVGRPCGHALLDLGVRLLLDARRDHAVQLDLAAADGLHQRALEAVVDGHDLAGRLHLGAEGVVRVDELVERPARELDDAVVEGRLEARLGLAGNGVRDLVQTVADRNLCGYLCNRVAGRLGSQCGGTGNTRVYLDYGVLKGFRLSACTALQPPSMPSSVMMLSAEVRASGTPLSPRVWLAQLNDRVDAGVRRPGQRSPCCEW